MHNVGQCFSHVEKGSYFAGDAYAVYSKYILTISSTNGNCIWLTDNR